MAALWSLYRPLLAAPWQMQRNASPWGFYLGWGFCLLGYGVALVLTAWFADAANAAKLAAVLLASAFLLPWITCFAGLLAQNHPHAARLVPGHVARLRHVALLSYGLTTVLAAAVLASQFGGGLAWLHGVALLLFGMALLARWYRLWVVASLVLFSIPWWSQFMPVLFVWSALLSWQNSQPWSLSLVLFLLLPWGLTRLIQTGGSEHLAYYQARQKLRRLFEAQSQGHSSFVELSGPAERLAHLFRWMQPRWMRHVLRQAQPTPASVMARLDLVTLGQAHWSCQLSSVSVVLPLLFLVFLALGWNRGEFWGEFIRHGSMGLSFGLASICLGVLLTVPANLYRSRREQALLMLLPGAPRGRQLNQLLGRRLLSQLLWGVGVATLLCLGLQLLPGPRALNWLGVHLCLAYLIIGALVLLRDWSRQSKPNSNGSVLPLLLALVLVGSLQGLQWLGLPILGQLMLVGLLFVGLVVWRWQQLVLRAPTAMPVGRWA